MKRQVAKSGLTLIEMMVVIAVVAILVVLSLPAARTLFSSFVAEGNVRAMLNAAMSSARALAAREQHYAGVRFQNRYQADNKGCQYMIFIINDTEIGPGVAGNLGCRAVEGLQPIKLPDSVGIMEVVNSNSEIDDPTSGELADKTTFSILFSPSGKLVIHDLWVRNRDNGSTTSKDDIFNTLANVTDGTELHGMFLQDESSGDLRIEPSKSKFRIYDKNIFEKVDKDKRYDDYLKDLEVIHINSYTGTIINK